MGLTPPGWYEDQDDPSLARWWDGDRWTEHTLVIAEQVPNVQPPPPPGYERGAGSEAFLEDDWQREDDWGPVEDPWQDATTAAPSVSVFDDPDGGAAPSEQTSVFAVEDEAPIFGGSWEVQEPYERRPTRGGWADQLRDLPPWARIALPVAIVVLLVVLLAAAGVLGGGGDGGDTADDEETTTTILDPVRVRSAALVAVREADLPSLTTSTFAELIPLACEAAAEDDSRELAAEIRELGLDASTLDRLLVGLEAGAEDYCPADLRRSPDLFDDLYRTLGIVPGAASTTTSSSSTSSTSTTTSTTRPTDTTRRTTTTTRPPPTSTTAAPTTTSTTVPPTSTTAPPSSTTTPSTTP